MRELVEICEPMIKQKAIALHFEADAIDKNLGKLYFDQEKVQLGIYHILQNAIKFNPQKGMIFITVEFKEKKLHYTIKDTGEGMSKNKIETSFNMFGNIDTFKEDRFLSTSGIGVGLSSSIKLA